VAAITPIMATTAPARLPSSLVGRVERLLMPWRRFD